MLSTESLDLFNGFAVDNSGVVAELVEETGLEGFRIQRDQIAVAVGTHNLATLHDDVEVTPVVLRCDTEFFNLSTHAETLEVAKTWLTDLTNLTDGKWSDDMEAWAFYTNDEPSGDPSDC